MQSIGWGLSGEPMRLAGALSLRRSTRGVAPSRLTATAEAQALDPVLLWAAGAPSGVRLECETTADAIEIDALLTRLQVGDAVPQPSVFDLVVDHEPARSVVIDDTTIIHVLDPATGEVELRPAGPTTVRFDGLGHGPKRIEVWLPHQALVEIAEVRLSDGATCRPAPPHPTRWVHYGSSISHCGEARRPIETWPALVARRRRLDLVNLGIAGQAQLDQFAARAMRDLAPDLISLKVGINVVNADSLRERTFVPALHGFLDTIRDGLPDTPILLVTPIICPAFEDRPGPTLRTAAGDLIDIDRPRELREGALTLRRIRSLIEQIVATRQSIGDEHLVLGNGLDLFGADDLDELPDGVHPSSEGYRRMAERFETMAFGGPWAGRS